ncbi:MAG: hypothetical protein QXJ56_03125 [Ignisphaera sp.]|uniref:Uncharacterized protein n=1 Tax=Ignisphaera aggregans TaxID=334771 RepID=A0A7J3I7W4_9CREN
MDGYEICVRRVSSNIIPGFIQFIEIVSGKSFIQLFKYNDVRGVLSKFYSTEVVDIIINILTRRIEEVCGKDC